MNSLSRQQSGQLLSSDTRFFKACVDKYCWAKDGPIAIQYTDLLHEGALKLQFLREFQCNLCRDLGISRLAKFLERNFFGSLASIRVHQN